MGGRNPSIQRSVFPGSERTSLRIFRNGARTVSAMEMEMGLGSESSLSAAARTLGELARG